MLFATTVLALSLLGTPATPCTAPAHTGIFRITALSKDSTQAKIGMILLESVGDCLEVSIVTDDKGPAILDNVALAGETLTGNLRLPTGTAKVSLRLTATTITGSIVEGKHQWNVSGRRTSGVETRVAAGEVVRE